MKKQGTENRDQADLERLLRSAVPVVDQDAGPSRNLWPELHRRIELHAAHDASRSPIAVPWYDWALAAAVLLMAVVSPVSVPVLLYYL